MPKAMYKIYVAETEKYHAVNVAMKNGQPHELLSKRRWWSQPRQDLGPQCNNEESSPPFSHLASHPKTP